MNVFYACVWNPAVPPLPNRSSICRTLFSISYRGRHAAAATALKTSFHSCLKLRPMLERAGARFEKPEGVPWDVDLSLEKITKDSILSLFSAEHG